MADRIDRPRHDPYVSGIRNDGDHATSPGRDTDACPWCTALGKAHPPATRQPVPHDPYASEIRDDFDGAADEHCCWGHHPQGPGLPPVGLPTAGWAARWSARLTGPWKSRDHGG
ncbi:hypothetical protein GCM10017771_83640 [Streptomyces capitiformicae]|uniref:Uncharacterized protein n=1 Tax=Streptomyces capitiformicae TaxID=2014920 RepID=A0A919DNM7_9ACTN|nr:hypothetical protein GCM10017771_83640 [Streptomyces capitiformicae]